MREAAKRVVQRVLQWPAATASASLREAIAKSGSSTSGGGSSWDKSRQVCAKLIAQTTAAAAAAASKQSGLGSKQLCTAAPQGRWQWWNEPLKTLAAAEAAHRATSLRVAKALIGLGIANEVGEGGCYGLLGAPTEKKASIDGWMDGWMHAWKSDQEWR